MSINRILLLGVTTGKIASHDNLGWGVKPDTRAQKLLEHEWKPCSNLAMTMEKVCLIDVVSCSSLAGRS